MSGRRHWRASDLVLHVDAFVNLVREPRLLTLTHFGFQVAASPHTALFFEAWTRMGAAIKFELLTIQNLSELDVTRLRFNRETTRRRRRHVDICFDYKKVCFCCNHVGIQCSSVPLVFVRCSLVLRLANFFVV